MIPSMQNARLRVLFVVDSMYWISATIAQQIVEHNSWIEPTICSHGVLRQVIARSGGRFPGAVDLVHFLTPHIATSEIDGFRDRLPCVVTIHHVENAASIAPARDADAIMTVCDQWHDDLLVRGIAPERLVMVKNGVETSLFSPPSTSEKARLRERFGIPTDAVVVGFTGKGSSNTGGRKGIDTLLVAMRRLASEKSVVFGILGPGWGDIVSAASFDGIQCRYFPFLLERHEVAEFYKTVDLFWVTSRIEGGPVPLIEAMSSATCCVSTPVGVAREIIEDGRNGYLAQLDDPQTYVSVTKRLMDDPDRRRLIGEAARQSVLDRFQARNTTQAVGQLYRTAFSQYAARNSQPRPTWAGIDNSLGPARRRVRSGRGLLCAIPAGLQSWVMAEEHLAFMQYLTFVGADAAAARIAARALAKRPFDRGVWGRAGPISGFRGIYKGARSIYRFARRPFEAA